MNNSKNIKPIYALIISAGLFLLSYIIVYIMFINGSLSSLNPIPSGIRFLAYIILIVTSIDFGVTIIKERKNKNDNTIKISKKEKIWTIMLILIVSIMPRILALMLRLLIV